MSIYSEFSSGGSGQHETQNPGTDVTPLPEIPAGQRLLDLVYGPGAPPEAPRPVPAPPTAVRPPGELVLRATHSVALSDAPRERAHTPADLRTPSAGIPVLSGLLHAERVASKAEQADHRAPQHVTHVPSSPTPSSGDTNPTEARADTPDPAGVEIALHQRHPLRISFTRTESNGPIVAIADPELIPRGAHCQDIEESDSNADAHNEGASGAAPVEVKPPEAPPAEQATEFPCTALLVVRPRTDSPDSRPDESPTSVAFNAAAVTAVYQGPFQLQIHATPVPAAIAQVMASEVGFQHHDAEANRQTERAAALGVYNRALHGGDGATAITTITVGARNSAELAAATTAIAAHGFGTDATWTVEPVVDPSGRVIDYPSTYHAALANLSWLSSLLPARAVAELVGYTETSVNGLTTSVRTSFAVGRQIEPGRQVINVGEVLDNYGRPSGDLPITTEDLLHHLKILGITGSGKTYFECYTVAATMAHFYERLAAGEINPEDIPTIVIFDYAKLDNVAATISRLMRAMGVPDEYATVDRLVFGGTEAGGHGILPNINPLRTSGNETIQDKIKEAASMIAETLAGIPDGQHVFAKYLSAAYELAADRCNGTPSPQAVRACLDEVIATTKFSEEVKGNLGSYTQTEFQNLLRGAARMLWQGGYEVDPEAIYRNGRPVVIELARLDPASRKLALATIFQGLIASAVAGTHGDVNQLKLLIVIEETGGLFDRVLPDGTPNALGARLASWWRVARGYGIGFAIVQQSELGDDTLKDVTDNTDTAITLHRTPATLDGPRNAAEAHLMGVKDGAGLMLAPGMPDGPTRIQGRDIEPLLAQSPTPLVTDGAHLLDKGMEDKTYDRPTREAAISWLRTPDGDALRVFMRTSLALTLLGRVPRGLLEEYRTRLASLLDNPATRDRTEHAINTAIANVINYTPAIQHTNGTSQEFWDYLRALTYGQIRGAGQPTERPPQALVLPEGRFAVMIDDLTAQSSAPLIDNPAYNRTFGRPDPNGGAHLPVAGLNAEEQRALLDVQIDAGQKLVATTLAAGQTLTDDLVRAAAIELVKLTPEGASPGERLAELFVPNTATQNIAYTQIAAAADALIAAGTVEARYPTMHAELDATILAYQNQAGIDMTAYAQAYGIPFGDMPVGTMAQQLAGARAMQAQHDAGLEERAVAMDLWFGFDPIHVGVDLDTAAAHFVNRSYPTGIFAQQLNKEAGLPIDTPISIATLILANRQDQVNAWVGYVTRIAAYGLGYFTGDMSTTMFLRDSINQQVAAFQAHAVRVATALAAKRANTTAPKVAS